jgi:hypothetical protein
MVTAEMGRKRVTFFNISDPRNGENFLMQEWERERRLRLRQQRIEAKKAKQAEEDI